MKIFRDTGLLLLLILASVAVAPAADANLVITGARQVSEADLRAAIAKDLTLWLAHHPAASRERWPAALAERVRAGYLAAGFRDVQTIATQDGDRTVLAIVEGRRWTCGELRLTGFGEQTELVRRALTLPYAGFQLADIDTLPEISPARWVVGHTVDWQPGACDRLANPAIDALRDAGFAGASVAARLLPRDDGVADCELVCSTSGKAIRLGSVQVTGLDASSAEQLRHWLALERDTAATATLAFTAAQRLRSCGRYSNLDIAWEDTPPLPTAEDLLLSTATDLEERYRLTHRRGMDAIARTGRADLKIAVRAHPGAAPPWQSPGPELACAFAARDRTLALLNTGLSALVIEAMQDGRRERLVWSPPHGLALVRSTGGIIAITSDGLVACIRGGRPLLLRIPHVFVTISLSTDANDPMNGKIRAECGASTVVKPLRIHVDMPPEAVATAALCVHPWQSVQERWQDGALERTVSTATSAWTIRLDPRSGISWRSGHVPASTATGDCRWSVGLEDGAWQRLVEPVIAGATPSATRPAGSLVEASMEVLMGLSGGPEFDRLCRHAADLARSGIIDALASWLPTFGDHGFDLPDEDGRRFRVPAMFLFPARTCAWIETSLAERLPIHAWPRQILRIVTCTLIGEKQLAIADLQQAVADQDPGPLGLLVFAHGLRRIGLTPLAQDMAMQGLGRCTADVIASEAHRLAGLAPDLLPLVACLAESSASSSNDAGRRSRLLVFAAGCRETGDPGVLWERAARQSIALGTGDWLRARFRDLLGDVGSEP